jgi:hypothetical protein
MANKTVEDIIKYATKAEDVKNYVTQTPPATMAGQAVRGIGELIGGAAKDTYDQYSKGIQEFGAGLFGGNGQDNIAMAQNSQQQNQQTPSNIASAKTAEVAAIGLESLLKDPEYLKNSGISYGQAMQGLHQAIGTLEQEKLNGYQSGVSSGDEPQTFSSATKKNPNMITTDMPQEVQRFDKSSGGTGNNYTPPNTNAWANWGKAFLGVPNPNLAEEMAFKEARGAGMGKVTPELLAKYGEAGVPVSKTREKELSLASQEAQIKGYGDITGGLRDVVKSSADMASITEKLRNDIQRKFGMVPKELQYALKNFTEAQKVLTGETDKNGKIVREGFLTKYEKKVAEIGKSSKSVGEKIKDKVKVSLWKE